MSAPHPCAVRGCSGLTHERYCEAHAGNAKRAHDDRLSAAKRGYGYQWRERTRKHILVRDPICKNPFNIPDHIALSTRVDHIIPKSQGGTDDEENLQGLCESCHNRKTAAEDGGFGRPGG